MLIVPDSEHEWGGSERRTVSARGATAAVMSRRDAGHQARVMGARAGVTRDRDSNLKSIHSEPWPRSLGGTKTRF